MHAKLLTAAFAALFLASCASVDLVGAYRLGKQDYKSVDPALWRAAVLRPTGADITELYITLKDEGDPEDAARFAFVAAEDAPAAELPKPKEDEILAVFRIDPEALEEARRLQKDWLTGEEPDEGDRSLGVNISLKLTKPYERAWCEGDEKMISPVWVRIEPGDRYRRILKPDALEKVMRPSSDERCAALARGDEDSPGATAPENREK